MHVVDWELLDSEKWPGYWRASIKNEEWKAVNGFPGVVHQDCTPVWLFWHDKRAVQYWQKTVYKAHIIYALGGYWTAFGNLWKQGKSKILEHLQINSSYVTHKYATLTQTTSK